MTSADYQEANGLIILKKKHPYIQQVLDILPEPEIHGGKLWGSSFLIMDYLEQDPPPEGARITEIGCGWGLLGIYCAREFDAEITGVDADPHVFPFLDVHAIINDVEIETVNARFEDMLVKDFRGQHMLLGGDICFWDELVDPLYSAIDKALRGGVKRIILADPGRDPFLKLARRCKRHFGGELVDYDIRKPKKVDGYLLIIDRR